MKITDEFIQSQTTPEYYDRGWDYYHQGRVRDFQESEDLITAVVSGSQDYKTKIDLTTLDYNCTCPAHERDRLCKHLVATMLTKVNGRIAKPLPTKKNNSKIVNKNPPVQSNEILEPNELKQKIKKMLNTLDRYWGNYWAGVDQQQRILEFVSSKVNDLQDSPETSNELLKTASWLDEELTHFDDSDGVLQETILEIVSKSVHFLEDSKSVSDLEVFYKYTSQGYEFDLGSDIVRLIFEEVENPMITNALGLEIEKATTGNNKRFSFDPKHALVFWSEYLKSHDATRFETLANKYYLQDTEICRQLVEFYVEKEKFKEAILVSWPRRHDFRLDILLISALEKSGETDKLIQYYQEECRDHLDREALGKLKEIYIQNNWHAEWGEYSQNLLKRSLNDWERVDLLMMLKRYVEAAEILGKVEFWPGQISVVDYAKKLVILDKRAGVMIYRSLLEKEAQKMVTSNFYPKLMEYLDKLLFLDDTLYIRKFIKETQEKYPTKKKLQLLLATYADSNLIN
ncbi:MAG: hypothetical protein AAB887_00915 [Patescibacteria group bacterium]